MAKAETQQTTAGDGSFKTTHWSAVLEADSGESAPAELASDLTPEKLFERRWL